MHVYIYVQYLYTFYFHVKNMFKCLFIFQTFHQEFIDFAVHGGEAIADRWHDILTIQIGRPDMMHPIIWWFLLYLSGRLAESKAKTIGYLKLTFESAGELDQHSCFLDLLLRFLHYKQKLVRSNDRLTTGFIRTHCKIQNSEGDRMWCEDNDGTADAVSMEFI